jgi:hypothetical protein
VKEQAQLPLPGRWSGHSFSFIFSFAGFCGPFISLLRSMPEKIRPLRRVSYGATFGRAEMNTSAALGGWAATNGTHVVRCVSVRHARLATRDAPLRYCCLKEYLCSSSGKIFATAFDPC